MNELWRFTNAAIWQLTFGAAFRIRNGGGLYRTDAPLGAPRVAMKRAIAEKVEELAGHYEQENQVNEDVHLKNIATVQQHAIDHGGDLLRKNVLSFGIAQKLFNLYLKHLWCLGRIQEPPHFPVDRQIQNLMQIPNNEIVNWTTADNDDYMRVIDMARERKADNEGLAQFELRIFNEEFAY